MMLPRVRRSSASIVASVGDSGGVAGPGGPGLSGPEGAQISIDPADFTILPQPVAPQPAPAALPGTLSIAKPLPEVFKLPVSPVFTIPASASAVPPVVVPVVVPVATPAMPGMSGDTHMDMPGSTSNGTGGSGSDGHSPGSGGSSDLISGNLQLGGAQTAAAGSGQSKGSGDQQKSASAVHVIVPASTLHTSISLATAAVKPAVSGRVTTGTVTAISSGKGKTTKTVGTTVGQVGATVSGRHLAR